MTVIPEPSGPPAVETAPAPTRVYAVGALKGGTGKSRIAMLIALFLALVLGRRVVFFDADSASQTGSKWPGKAAQRGYTRWPFEVIRYPFDDLDAKVDEVIARGNVDDIVIDVGGGNVTCFMAAVRRCHTILVPLCPDEGDTDQAPPTREAVLMAASRNTTGEPLSMYYLLNRCENSNDRIDARARLLNEDQPDGEYPLLDIELPLLVAYKRTYGRIPGSPSACDPTGNTPGEPIEPDYERPRWRDLKNFLPLLVETEIITRQQAVDSGLIVERQLQEAGV